MGRLSGSDTVVPGLHIDVPPGFAGIPITGSGEQIAARVRALATKAAETTEHSAEELAESIGAMAHFMAREDIRLFGRFAVSDETMPEPVLANLALAMVALDVDSDLAETVGDNRGEVAKQLVRRYRERFPDADVHPVTLDAGPAMVAQRAGEYHIPAELTRGRGAVVRTEFKAEFQIPSPDGRRLVVMTVTTGDERAWPLVAAEAVRIANSIAFPEPEPADEQRGG